MLKMEKNIAEMGSLAVHLGLIFPQRLQGSIIGAQKSDAWYALYKADRC